MNELRRLPLFCFLLVPIVCSAQSLSSESSNPPVNSTGAGPAVPPTQLPPVVVTANAVQPTSQQLDVSADTSTYTLTQSQISTIAQGQNTSFNQVLVRTPGVSDDTYGAVHFRNEDPFYRYYINGTLLPPGITGFDQDIDTHFVASVTTKIGALPAYY